MTTYSSLLPFIVLIISGSIFVIAVILFLIIRPYNSYTYFPRERRNRRTRLAWMIRVFKADDSEIVTKCGLYGDLFLLFNKYLIYFGFVCSVLSCAILIPINVSQDQDLYASSTQIKEPYLWAHSTLILIYSLLAYFLVWRFQRKFIEISRGWRASGENPQTFSVKIKHIPPAVNTNERLTQFFSTLYPGELIAAHVAYDVNKLLDEKKALLYAEREVERAECKTNKNHGQRPRVFPKLSVNLQAFAWLLACCCYSRRVDAIDHYTVKRDQLREQVAAHQNEANPGAGVGEAGATHVAFITFRSGHTALRAVKNFSSAQARRRFFGEMVPPPELRVGQWSVKQAPVPTDIKFRNLRYRKTNQNIRKIFTYILAIIIAFAAAIPVTLLVTLRNKDLGLPVLANDFVVNYLPSGLQVVFQIIQPFILQWITYFELPHTKSSFTASVMHKLYLYLILNCLIVQSLLLSGYNVELAVLYNPVVTGETIVTMNFELQGAFYVNYLLQLSFLGSAWELLHLFDLLLRIVRRKWFSSSPRDFAVANRALYFRYFVRFPETLLVITIMMVFSVIFPLVMPAGLLYLILRRYIDKMNMLLISPRDEGDGRMLHTVIYFFLLGVCLFQLVGILFLSLREAYPTLGLILFLPVTTFLLALYVEYVFRRERKKSLNLDVIGLEQEKSFALKTAGEAEAAILSKAYLHKALRPHVPDSEATRDALVEQEDTNLPVAPTTDIEMLKFNVSPRPPSREEVV
eukprot:TRINITY_DN12321_c0_g1_i1.p1 TRINITY_DN12321_c0_g1~~TRINITY_DN12321_c0_g1_i1.p1  ORF type:complete len:746 (+),score=111.68 TRINITY_DN12321_c0_g1_i1:167-2404(+)